ncbi:MULTISPECIES: GrpB family protein [Staphylococcus]|uniref:GrpB family protein n=1 Tax=Staphylococcus TaxID=1279 RepID=UPI000CD308D6|nr:MULTISPECIES: GrpB family protein [Staphylococcus]MCI2954401.1 GrpB family protein [Staphylococcus caprae]POA07786.1 hypothetical protein CD155_00790 [Staphylococcus caprae]SUL96235.1 putative GrpB family protein [Staphylococcus caprae]HCG74932.1 hypothetical protein [Staphylococcus sp.]
MYAYVQPLVKNESHKSFEKEYLRVKNILFGLLDSPVKYTQHIGGTRHFNYETEPILDVLVGVDNLHDITALDEKRLNYAGFYRLHHSYKKKVMMARFNNFSELKQEVRLHIIQLNTPLFEQYQNVDKVLSQDNEISQLFSKKKQDILKHVQTIRMYENQKQNLFEKIHKQLS